MIETIFEKGKTQLVDMELGRLAAKLIINSQHLGSLLTKKPNCLSIVFAEKHPGAFSNCCATSCYINVKIVKYLW